MSGPNRRGKSCHRHNEFFLVIDLNDLTPDEEIYESLDSASKYSELYRDVHTELKLKL